MHWGIEYKLKQNKQQEELADFLFNNGVDLILGSHPHVLEPMEKRTQTNRKDHSLLGQKEALDQDRNA